MQKIILVAGARPNFMKIGPIYHELVARGCPPLILHTGQHYDHNMSDIFFEQLGLPAPDLHLGVGSASHGVQTGKIMIAFEEIVNEHNPDIVIVAGDVNSTIACALVAVKRGIPVAHVEAGLRSFDRTMPEEINRILTDQISDFLFTPSPDGDAHLKQEGIDTSKIFRVGNVMIDSLLRLLPAAEVSEVLSQHELKPQGYGVVTLHRPANVDDPIVFARILEGLMPIQKELPLLFPVHPRTRVRIERLGLEDTLAAMPGLRLIDPVGYMDFLALQRSARVVLTDSGGIQEETTYLKVPCITIRENTERPITIEMGTNQLVGSAPDKIIAAYEKVKSGALDGAEIPPLWDGKTAKRIVDVLVAHGLQAQA